ncbi:MAG: DUF1538 domain-containing protein [Clostridiales bacterium]|nr:DUF1538 domain-containing protein [Clostridiales bacterium]
MKQKLQEALSAVLPLSIIIILLSLIAVPVSDGIMAVFIIGVFSLIIGMFLFTFGADSATMPMGESIGAYLSRSKKIWLILLGGFIIGVFITVAEPDLAVLSRLVPSVPTRTLTLTIAIGVGAFLVVSFLRTLFKIKLQWILLGFYGVIFAIASVIPQDFLGIAFDSGGVTTGPVSVPFILALGAGVAAVRDTKDKGEESFGAVALCSIGPILSVLILSLLFKGENSYESTGITEIAGFSDAVSVYLRAFPEYLKEVAVALSPIVLLFILFQIFAVKLPPRKLISIGIGLIFTYFGLVLFLMGANVGFIPIGQIMGASIATSPYAWSIIPLGFLMGFVVVMAEPAIHVLKQEVEEVTNGAISERAIITALSIGIGISVALAMLRVYTGLNLWWIILPGYILALIISFFVPPIYTAIAFDSGGVASGPMTSTFLLAFSLGASNGIGGNILRDAFGLVALVALTPLVAIQVLGLASRMKPVETVAIAEDVEIIEFDWRETL